MSTQLVQQLLKFASNGVYRGESFKTCSDRTFGSVSFQSCPDPGKEDYYEEEDCCIRGLNVEEYDFKENYSFPLEICAVVMAKIVLSKNDTTLLDLYFKYTQAYLLTRKSDNPFFEYLKHVTDTNQLLDDQNEPRTKDIKTIETLMETEFMTACAECVDTYKKKRSWAKDVEVKDEHVIDAWKVCREYLDFYNFDDFDRLLVAKHEDSCVGCIRFKTIPNGGEMRYVMACPFYLASRKKKGEDKMAVGNTFLMHMRRLAQRNGWRKIRVKPLRTNYAWKKRLEDFSQKNEVFEIYGA